jgi:hypothetical protein
MMDQVKILTARRSYEFRPDELRLTVLSVAEIHDRIRKFFSFQAAGVGTPQQTFDSVPLTMPPGVALDFGTTQTPEADPTPMRFMHFEAQRIVIDVAGPSSAIDWTFDELQRILADKKAPDGSPVIGEPQSIRDYSEISGHFDFDFEDMVAGPFLELAQETFKEEGKRVLPLSIKFQPVNTGAEVHPGQIGLTAFSQGNHIEFRAGTRPEDRTYFSTTSLPTDQHIAWLEALNQRLGKD